MSTFNDENTMNAEGRPRIDYTNKDYASLREALLDLAREKLPEWTDQSSNDPGVVLLELVAYMGDVLLYYQDRIANESYLDTAVERRSVINLLRLIGHELRPPQPASADLTLLFEEPDEETAPSAQPSEVTITSGTTFQTKAQATGEPIAFEYVRPDLAIDLGKLGVQQRDGKNYRCFQTLPVVQVDAEVSGEILGSSDGSAGQRFKLARKPLIDDDFLEVTVDEGVGPVAWQRQETLLHSYSGDTHFQVRRDENDDAWIEFGDGKYGQIPRRGQNNIVVFYRVGGGIKGNVPSQVITEPVGQVEFLKYVYNEKAATGGAEAESSVEAATRGPQLFRAMGRAVTAQDYEAHAREFGVGKIRARAASWNRIELFVAPAGGGYPTDTFKKSLLTYLENKRIITSILDIQDPQFVTVCIEGDLEIEARFFHEQVRQQVEKAIHELLAFENVEFGDRLYLSKVYEAIEAVPGVASVYVSRFARSDSTRDLPEDGKLEFDWSEIPRTGPVQWKGDRAGGKWEWRTAAG